MNAKSLTIAATVKSMRALDSSLPNEVSSIMVQAPAANAAVILFGNSETQVFELNAGDPWISIPAQVSGGRLNLNEVYLSGTSGDKLSVNWIQLGKVSQ